MKKTKFDENSGTIGDYEILGTLGTGAYSEVKLVLSQNGQKCAMKVLKYTK